MAMSGVRMKNLSNPIIVPACKGIDARSFRVLSETLMGILTTERRLVDGFCWDTRRSELLNSLRREKKDTG